MRVSRMLSAGVAACTLVMGIAGCANQLAAPAYPTRAVRVVVPYPAGNAADSFGRLLADKLAQQWGQPVTVENVAGSGTVPGVNAVAKAPADGYTLLVHSISFAVDASLYTGLPYDAARDFTAVAPIAKQPFALVASPGAGIGTVADLVAKARAKPGEMKFASLGATTQIFFVAEQFKKQAGVSAGNVSYKSVLEANTALAKGDAAFWFPPVAGALPGIREGKLVPLAVTAERRLPSLPNVPTMAEAGVPGMTTSAWFGVWAPAAVPVRVVNRLARDIESALAAPDIQEKLARMGAEPMRMSPNEFGAFVTSEIESSRRFTRELGIQPQLYNPPKPQ